MRKDRLIRGKVFAAQFAKRSPFGIRPSGFDIQDGMTVLIPIVKVDVALSSAGVHVFYGFVQQLNALADHLELQPVA